MFPRQQEGMILPTASSSAALSWQPVLMETSNLPATGPPSTPLPASQLSMAASGFLPPAAAAAAGPCPPTVLVTNANGLLVRPLALLTSPLQVLPPWGGAFASGESVIGLGSPGGACAGANGGATSRPPPLMLYHLNSLPNSPIALKSQWNLWM